MNPIHFLRMARWVRHPPSRRRLILVAVVLGTCLVIVGLEWLGLVPDWLGLEPGRRLPLIKPLP